MEVGTVDQFRVLHTPGSGFVTIAGSHHSEQHDLPGWRSRLAFYRRMAERQGGQFRYHYSPKIKACEMAVRLLEAT